MNPRSQFRSAVLGLAAWAVLISSAGADDQQSIYRFAPDAGGLSVVQADELKPGRIYNHFNPRLGRRAWSFYQGNGQFWHAFGVGSIQPVRDFDLNISPTEGLERLRALDPELAREVSITGSLVYVQLGADGRWSLLPRDSVPRVFDAETGTQWEKQFGSYIPVIRTRPLCPCAY